MGPIVGVGYSIATNDFDTLKSAVRNLLIFVIGSVLASMIYFILSPIKTLTDQLASRTEPTFYDVLIAICGGAIGIVASSRKDRGNAIPGVAIATALMPPLCTVGYGLATGQFAYAGGAFYLFFINSVFIAGTAWVFVRALKFPKKKFLNQKSEKRINQIMLVIVLITIIPSFYTAFNLIKKEFFFSKVEVFSNYITDYQLEKGMFVGELKKEYNTETPIITITVMGDILEKDKYNIEHQLEQSGLTKTKLIFREWGGGDALNGKVLTERLSHLQDRYSNIIEELYEDNRKNLKNKEDRIAFLEEELAKRETKIVKSTKPVEDIAQEFAALYPDAHEVAYNEVIQYNTQSNVLDTLPLVTIDWEGRRLNDEKKERMLNFFKVRMKLDTVKVVFH